MTSWENINPLSPIYLKNNEDSDRSLSEFKNLPKELKSFLQTIASASPHLRKLLKSVEYPQQYFDLSPQKHCEQVLNDLNNILNSSDYTYSTDEIMSYLRKAKQKIALTIALADLAGLFTLDEVTHYLSSFADLCLEIALIYALKQSLRLDNAYNDWPECNKSLKEQLQRQGVTILAMGKLGASELNYSSDIDLIILYEPDYFYFCDQDRLDQGLTRAIQLLTRIMETKTQDGYVFRIDLRLRPDPNITPPILPILTAETYYESQGLNWERAAMIKARICAGNQEIGKQFLKQISPFIWRKHLDFAAIEDIRTIRKRIEHHRKGKEIVFAGHNIKLGHGGIREIEFFVQTHQLIWGGRRPALRCKKTLDGLAILVQEIICSVEQKNQLSEAYHFLRKLEHRLQMIDDLQTQKMPETEMELSIIACLMGYDQFDKFQTDYFNHLNEVGNYFDQFFYQENDQFSDQTQLDFLNFDKDTPSESILNYLTDFKLKQTDQAYRLIQGWHKGRIRALHSERARNLLSNQLGVLFEAIKNSLDPDRALIHFDQFISKLPAGVQLFSLFDNNPTLIATIINILGNAPRLGELLAKRPQLIEIFLDPAINETFLTSEALEAVLQTQLTHAPHQDYEQILILCREFSADYQFHIGVQYLNHQVDWQGLSNQLTNLAETLIQFITPKIIDDFSQYHGVIANSGFCLLALGKLGSSELLHASDLDLLFIYDVDKSEDHQLLYSDGQKPLGVEVYYQRLAQRFVSAFNREMQGGKLYEIDLRFRPSASPLAVQFRTLQHYYQLQQGKPSAGTAWNFEYMALTKARPIFESKKGLAKKIMNWRQACLGFERDQQQLTQDIVEMRKKIADQYSEHNLWDIKHRRGGLIDCEFLIQYQVLRYAYEYPALIAGNPTSMLTYLLKLREAHLFDDQSFEILNQSMNLWQSLQALFRLTLIDEKAEFETMPTGLQQSMIKLVDDIDSIDELKQFIEKQAEDVRTLFNKLIK